MKTAKVQHYVPQFLLRNFGNGKKDQLWVFDKTTGRSFSTNAKNIASESRFYEFEYAGARLSLEPYLSKIESSAKPILSHVLRADSLADLDATARATIAVFLSIQLTRTRTFREQWRDFPRMLRDALDAKGDRAADGSQAAELIRDISDNDVKSETGRFMVDAPKALAHHFLSKDWALAATTRMHPFVTSDNPLALQNVIDRPHRGNLGLAVPGIEIYLPLSPIRALAMWCRSLTGSVLQASAEHPERFRHDSGGSRAPEGVIGLADALSTDRPLAYSAENVENFNSLQIARSERYVFSFTNDFELAKEMLGAQPSLRAGPRLEAH
jgi:hypothetical protein